jgi:hypothetical protein
VPATGPSSAAAGPRQVESAEPQPVDLLGVAGAPLTKRLIPIAIGAVVLFVLWRILRH